MDFLKLLNFALKHRASDIHLSANLAPMIRVDGEIHRINLPVLTSQAILDMLGSMLSEKQIQQFQQQLELDCSCTLEQTRLRINLFHQNNGISAVLRIIPAQILSISQLGINAETFHKITQFSRGLVLVTGATGSGKSTTLASMLEYINQHQFKHILTLEDPIEYIYTSQKCLINQREIQRDSHSFQNALRSALREDPDIILIGELRDLESIRLALTAAETGHLVFATLHTASAIKSIDRIIDVFPAEEKALIRTMLADSLQAIIAQSLVKKRESGRVAVHEILLNIPAVSHLIRENKIGQIYSLMQTNQQLGMITLDQSLQQLYEQGLIDLTTVQQLAKYPENFTNL